MKIQDFGVEMWMNAYENDCAYNLAETCVESLTVAELLALSGDTGQAFDDILHMKLTYGAIEGSARLRQAIASLFQTVETENIAVTHGAVGANGLTMLALVEPGDHVVSVLPTYQQMYSIPASIGAQVSILRLKEENGWLPDLAELEKLAKPGTKLICINNPNNPTGAVMDEAYLKEIGQIAKNCGAYLLCDEVYRGLTHEGNPFTGSIVDLYEKGISVGSMSKTFSLAGLRLGWVVGPAEFIARVNSQRDYHVISIGMIDDYLASLALENKEKILERNLAICRANGQMLSDWVSKEPHISYVKPKGGTIAFLKYDLPMPSAKLCRRLQAETGVMLLPGSALDMEGYLRIGYANNPQIIAKGLALFSDWLSTTCLSEHA